MCDRSCKGTMKNFKVGKYLGKWFEIAKYPSFFETDCNGATAEYRWNEKSKVVSVLNKCLINYVPKREIRGFAWIPNESCPSKLKIRFENNMEGDYWVLWTDYCNYSIVGSPNMEFLWILSRKPTIPCHKLECLFKKIRKFGYNVDRLILNYYVISR